MKIALIIGAGGQDGSYLLEFLIEKKYKVHGIIRQSSVHNTQRIDHLLNHPNVEYHRFDIQQSFAHLLKKIKPDEIYNLAALSFVKTSFDLCNVVFETNTKSVLNLLEDVRLVNPKIKVYQASTSEMFGSSYPPQCETTPFQPNSPYAISKLSSYWIVKTFRQAYNLFAVNGILFNHESPRRGMHFVTRKICNTVANIYHKRCQHVELGNIDAKRDWGHAKDYVECMWLMLQHDKPDDFVVGTGESHSVREFVEYAFNYIGLKLSWKGQGVDEVGVDQNDVVRVKINPIYFRLTDVEHLEADARKVHDTLGWSPKISFQDMIKDMMDFELKNTHS